MKTKKKQSKYIFVFIMLLAISLAGGIFTMVYVKTEEGGKAAEEEELLVVTSFYPVYIAAENVIGDSKDVTLQNLSEPQTGCMHDYQLTPQDMILLSKADVFIVNGGGIENFLTDVAEAYPDLTIIYATDGLELLGEEDDEEAHEHGEEHGEDSHDAGEHSEDSHDGEEHSEDSHDAGEHSEDSHDGEEHGDEEDGHVHSHGDENAHAWMNTGLYAEMVNNIAAGLSEADQTHSMEYAENAEQYCEKINKLTDQINELKEILSGKNVIIFHEAYEYVAQQYGMNVAYCLDLDEERQVSAGEVAEVMEQIQENQVSVILAEELYGKDMGDTVEREGECRVYYLDALIRGTYEKDSYLNAMQANIDLMREIAGKE